MNIVEGQNVFPSPKKQENLKMEVPLIVAALSLGPGTTLQNRSVQGHI